MKNLIRLVLAAAVIVYLFIHLDNIIPASEEDTYTYTGDFNGDSLIDTMKVLSYGIFNPPKLYKTINPWSGERLKEGENRVFLISHQGEELKYIVHDSSFLATPIWQERKPPVAILKKGSKDYIYSQDMPYINGDALILGTEAGIDILLYWDGNTYTLYWPNG
jgi:hypothetical protein